MQVGFSYSDVKDDYNTDDTQTAADNVAALIAFMRKFPEHSSNNLYLTGESYAGHYVPTLAKAILDHNAQSSPKLNLQGFAVGNPLTNEVVRQCVLSYANYLMRGRSFFLICQFSARFHPKSGRLQRAYVFLPQPQHAFSSAVRLCAGSLQR